MIIRNKRVYCSGKQDCNFFLIRMYHHSIYQLELGTSRENPLSLGDFVTA
jgi:hypothetical protein